MKINVEQNDQIITIYAQNNRNIKLNFLSDGSDLNNEKLLMFLVKLASQDDNTLELNTSTPNLEVNFIIELLQQFNKTILKEKND